MRLLLLISSFLLTFSLHAQHIRVGLMYTDIYHAPFVENHTPKLRTSLGFNVSIDPSHWSSFFLQVETRYAEKGYKTLINHGNTSSSFQLDFHYLSHSVLTAYQVHPAIAPYVGVELGILLRANLDSSIENIHIKDTYRQTDLGLLAGAQFFRKSRISADLRITSSLLPQLRYETFDNFGNPTGRVQGINHLTIETAAMLRLFKFKYQQ